MIETGTPWRVRPCAEGYMIETARGRRVVRGSGGVRDREVAEHIARAVNGQAALVAACQAARRALAAGFAQDGAEVPQPVRHAMDLLERGLAVAVPMRAAGPGGDGQGSTPRSKRGDDGEGRDDAPPVQGLAAYLAKRRECGCRVAVVVDDPYMSHWVADRVRQFVADGLVVERVPLEAVNTFRGDECTHRREEQAA